MGSLFSRWGVKIHVIMGTRGCAYLRGAQFFVTPVYTLNKAENTAHKIPNIDFKKSFSSVNVLIALTYAYIVKVPERHVNKHQ